MSKERTIARLGFAAAALSANALGACSAERNSAPIIRRTVIVPPEQCVEVLPKNIRICNYSNNNNYRVAEVDRFEYGKWLWVNFSEPLPHEATYTFEGELQGISVKEDFHYLHAVIEEPILSATPFPSPTPTQNPNLENA